MFSGVGLLDMERNGRSLRLVFSMASHMRPTPIARNVGRIEYEAKTAD
jgi:hypothetical protein